MGVLIFLASLGMLFAATVIGFAFIRVTTRDAWPDLPPLPRAIWISTGLLIASAAAAQMALWSVQSERGGPTTAWLAVTTILGLAFLALQAVAWWRWFEVVGPRWADSAAYRWALASFYVLTGLHAAHVIGGLVPLVVTAVRSGRRRYTSDDHAGVYGTVMYWHFLDAVWLVLLLAMFVAV